jgi:outer membrane lipoprotein-sorting protein
MKLLCPTLLLGSMLFAASGEASGANQPPDRPAAVSVSASLDTPEWVERFDQLRASPAWQASFTERRHFGFRAQPVVLEGDMRLSRQHGLSLQYRQPDDHLVVVDDHGILVRDARGRTRRAPAEASAAVEHLLPILRLDLETLRRSFELSGEQTPDGWTLHLQPRTATAGSPGPVRIQGRGGMIESLTLQPTPRRRVEITLSQAQPRDGFTDDDIRRYFRE